MHEAVYLTFVVIAISPHLNDAKKAVRREPVGRQMTSLHELILSPSFQISMLDALLKDGGSLDERDGSGHTVLMVAALTKTEDLVEELLARDADPLAQDPQGSTALHMAASMGYGRLFNMMFIKAGPRGLEVVNTMGSTPLHLAARSGHASMVSQLLQLGANAKARDRSGKTAEDEARTAAAQRPGREAPHQSCIQIIRAAITDSELSDMQGKQRRDRKPQRVKRKRQKVKQEL